MRGEAELIAKIIGLEARRTSASKARVVFRLIDKKVGVLKSASKKIELLNQIIFENH